MSSSIPSNNADIRVGILGLGIIGSRIAGHLLADGFSVSAWNRTPKTATAAAAPTATASPTSPADPRQLDIPASLPLLATPAEVAARSDILQFFVADPLAVFEVLDAIGDALAPRHLVVCSSTIGQPAVLEAARRVEARGARFLDAPFTGTKGAAEKRGLVYYTGGAEVDLECARPVLAAVSKAIVPMGEIGHAALVKVLTNVLSAAAVEALAETLAVLKKQGLPPELMARALELHGARSGMSDLKLPKLLTGDYEPHFSLKHMLKDVQFGLDQAAALGLALPVTEATAAAMREGVAHGWADLDFSIVMKRYETAGPQISAEALREHRGRRRRGKPHSFGNSACAPGRIPLKGSL